MPDKFRMGKKNLEENTGCGRANTSASTAVGPITRADTDRKFSFYSRSSLDLELLTSAEFTKNEVQTRLDMKKKKKQEVR